MKKLLLLALAALSLSITATAQQFHWAKTAVSNVSVATDKAGNVYTVGYVETLSPVDIDPGPGVFNVSGSMFGAYTVYVLKLDKNGNFVWARDVNSMGFDTDFGLAVDDSQNVYVAGFISDDPMDAGYNGFVTRINNNGTLGWSAGFGNYDLQVTVCSDVAVDSFGNVYVTGRSTPTFDIDPDPVNTINASGNFVVKLSNTGQYISHIEYAGGWLIEVSRDGNEIYTTGPYSQFTQSDYPLRLAKHLGDGTLVWSHYLDSLSISTLNITEPGKIYATGHFTDTVDFDPGAGVTELMTAGANDQFLMKMDTSGTFIWAKQLGGSSNDEGAGVVLDGEGHLFTCGVFSGTVDMDPGVGISNLTSMTPGVTDIFIQKLDTAGDLIWAAPIGTTSGDKSFDMAIDTAGAIFIIGKASGADLDPGTPVVGFPVTVNHFLTKWSDTVVTISAKTVLDTENKIILFPNPSNGTINVSAEQVIDNISVSDISGRVIFTSTPANKRTSIDIATPGIYFISVITGDKTSRGKVLIQ